MTTTVNIHEAKTHLSRLVEQASRGQEFVIAKAGKPLVRLVPVGPALTRRTLGFLAGHGVLGADLKRDFAQEVDALFHARP